VARPRLTGSGSFRPCRCPGCDTPFYRLLLQLLFFSRALRGAMTVPFDRPGLALPVTL
jgi:hypothetical protein